MARNLLVYFVIDNSGSMNITDKKGIKRIDGALSVLDGLNKAIEESNLGSLKTLVKPAVISFNQTAVLVFPDNADNIKNNRHMRFFKENLSLIKETIKKNCKDNQTFYTEVFKYVGNLIKHDQEKMIENGETYYRPLICFITDGKPEGEHEKSENIRNAFNTLFTPNAGHEAENEVKSPVVFCVGVGDGQENDWNNLKQYGAGRLATRGGKKITSNYRRNNGDLVKQISRDYTFEFGALTNEIINTILLSFSPVTNGNTDEHRQEWDIVEVFDSNISPISDTQIVL